MPLEIPAPGVLLTRDNFAAKVKASVDANETAAANAQATANAAKTKADAAYVKPPAGAGLDFLSAAALGGLVQTDGTVLRAVKLTQAAYDALTTKVATTLYIIIG